ncbi:hypothetical protein HYX01_01040 [Candidatus Woesearchaeota archaeon]|nr:hypothetical protein [Candidatus Woesearchaeota archaeon]
MQRLAIGEEEKIFWDSLWNKRISPGKYRQDRSQIEKILRPNVRGNTSDFLTFDLLEVPMWYVHLSSVLSSVGIPYELIDLN